MLCNGSSTNIHRLAWLPLQNSLHFWPIRTQPLMTGNWGMCLEPQSVLLIALGKGCRKMYDRNLANGPMTEEALDVEGTSTWIFSNWIHDLKCHPSQRRCFWLRNFAHFLRLLKMSTWPRTAWTSAAISELHAHKRFWPLQGLKFSSDSAVRCKWDQRPAFHHRLMS